MKIKFISNLLSIAILALFLGASPAAFAASASGNFTVDVNISSVGTIIVTPTALSWTGVNPGANTAASTLIIKNTGSMNLSSIYLNTSTYSDESTNPLTTADPSAYSAAGLIFVKNSTETTYYHAGRLEWNLSSYLAGETLNLNAATTNFGHGWYRNSSGNEYLWKVENGTNGLCNNSGTTFSIKTAPENSTNLNRNLAGFADCGTVTAGTNWATFACVDGPLAGHCVATAKTCDKIEIYKYNYASDFPACGNRAYLRSNTLIPGDEDSISVYASVPYGMPAGDTTTGTLTIIATY